MLPVYAYCPFVVYTCLQSTSPLFLYRRPYDLRLLRVPTKPLRVARRLSITAYELPRYTTRSSLRQDLALPYRWETSAPKTVGCIYWLHPGCHAFEDTRLHLPSIGFLITETPYKGFSFVASRSRMPRRTTCPPLCSYAGCWPRVPFTTPPVDVKAWRVLAIYRAPGCETSPEYERDTCGLSTAFML